MNRDFLKTVNWIILQCVFIQSFYCVESSAEEKDEFRRTQTMSDSVSESELPELIGLNINITLNSAYAWRGLNLSQETHQRDQNGLFSPSIKWQHQKSGLSFQIWGSYQVRGNVTYNMENGTSHDHGFNIQFDRDFFNNKMSLNLLALISIMPFASDDPDTGVGTSCPVFFDAAGDVTYHGFVDVGFNVSNFIGVQEEVKSIRHLYLRPYIAKHVEVGDLWAVELSTSFGYKIYYKKTSDQDSTFDVNFSLAFPVDFSRNLTVEPSLNVTWTDLHGVPVGDEYFLWLGLSTDINF